MTSCHVFIATSLDGFIARENGDTDWLENWPDVGHDYGYSDFMASVDGLIIGRGTFEKALSFGHWPYDKPVACSAARSARAIFGQTSLARSGSAN